MVENVKNVRPLHVGHSDSLGWSRVFYFYISHTLLFSVTLLVFHLPAFRLCMSLARACHVALQFSSCFSHSSRFVCFFIRLQCHVRPLQFYFISHVRPLHATYTSNTHLRLHFTFPSFTLHFCIPRCHFHSSVLHLVYVCTLHVPFQHVLLLCHFLYVI